LRKFVLDSSVALSWCFPDERDLYAVHVKEAMRHCEAHVPAIWWLECANALLMAQRRGRFTSEDWDLYLRIMLSISILQDTEPQNRRLAGVVALARAHNLSAYDASYLELAVHLNLPIATLDDRLRAAAAQAGVELFNAEPETRNPQL